MHPHHLRAGRRLAFLSAAAAAAFALTSTAWAASPAKPAPASAAPAAATPAAPAAGRVEILSHGYFNQAQIYRPSGEPRGVALLVSGTDGWTAQDGELADSLRRQGVLTAGLDLKQMIVALRKDGANCLGPRGDFDNFSRVLQARYQLNGYSQPILVGNGPVAAGMAYGTQATASEDTFSGAISLGFVPQTLALPLPLCKEFTGLVTPINSAATEAARIIAAPPPETKSAGKGAKGTGAPAPAMPRGPYVYRFEPTAKFADPWLVFPTPADGPEVADFVRRVPNGALMATAITPANVDAQLAEAITRLKPHQQETAAPPTAVSDLPLVEVPTKEPIKDHDLLAVMISGDGGWAGIDKDLASAMNRDGIPVVGFDSLRYFWKARTPESTARDVERVIRYYQAQPAWKRVRVLLIGYSQGADVMPFVINRLPADLRAQLASVILIGMGEKASFEFHVTNWIKTNDKGAPTLPEAEKMPRGLALCAYGVDDKDAVCPRLNKPGSPVRLLALKGGHHFDGNYDNLATALLQATAKPPMLPQGEAPAAATTTTTP
ncbi:MAG: hypothetical protein GAK30_01107 [Paracidovorax wautersii]|uniref:Bacterial virulence domain-containing protein n=1 Tax=Paracidovorax wautersii TaxID=1177982 RepID=A0A7V8FQJ4_9BURK|nr:MAG: hypothetical protein GAK30_01107 [Paracidovorax wautersii]